MSASPPAQPIDRLCHWLARRRRLFLALGALIVVLQYSGRWRIGRDSALYRAVAHSLAVGDGYAFRGEPEALVHPGYPLLLAAVERATGDDQERPAVALGLMVLSALATLWLLDRLLRARQPPWVASTAVLLLALNPGLVALAGELRPDLLFLAATALALLGVERLARQPSPAGARRDGAALALVALGMASAWILRPTFWFLVAALVVTAARGALPAERRAVVLASAVAGVVALLVLALDPRTGGLAPQAGGYEQAILGKLLDPERLRWREHLALLVEDSLPRAIVGLGGHPWVGSVLSIGLVVSATRTGVRTWSTYAVVTLGGAVLLGANPRYLIAIAPFVVVGALREADRLARRAPWPRAAAGALLAALALLALPAGLATLRTVLAQRGLAARPDARYLPYATLAPVLAVHTGDGDLVLSSEPRILSYLSGRQVIGPGEVAHPSGSEPTVAELLDAGFTHVVLSDDPDSDDGARLRALVARAGWTTEPVASAGGLVLARLGPAPGQRFRSW